MQPSTVAGGIHLETEIVQDLKLKALAFHAVLMMPSGRSRDEFLKSFMGGPQGSHETVVVRCMKVCRGPDLEKYRQQE